MALSNIDGENKTVPKLNQTAGHWYSMKLCENTSAVRSDRSHASGKGEEQARRGAASLRLRCATLRRNGKGSTASEEVYESSVIRFRLQKIGTPKAAGRDPGSSVNIGFPLPVEPGINPWRTWERPSRTWDKLCGNDGRLPLFLSPCLAPGAMKD
jgi:hypothetical protein